MSQPKIKISSLGAIYIRAMIFEKAGDVEFGHSHTFDHLTILTRGSLMVESNGKRSVFKADPVHVIAIPKHVVHRLEALEDNTVACCVHPLRAADDPGEIIDPSQVPAGTPIWSLAFPLLDQEITAKQRDTLIKYEESKD